MGDQDYAENKGLLPKSMDRTSVEHLIAAIEGELAGNFAINEALDNCNLQPTTRANWLAAASAVNVLLAHEMGQEVAQDERKE